MRFYLQTDEEKAQKAQARKRRKSGKFTAAKAKLVELCDMPLARAAHECGGTLIGLSFKPMPPKELYYYTHAYLKQYAPGCGGFTFVAGTNGGKMRCGATITWSGEKGEQYFCASCEKILADIGSGI